MSDFIAWFLAAYALGAAVVLPALAVYALMLRRGQEGRHSKPMLGGHILIHPAGQTRPRPTRPPLGGQVEPDKAVHPRVADRS